MAHIQLLIVFLGVLPFALSQTTASTHGAFVQKLKAAVTKLWPTADSNNDGKWTKADIVSLFTTYDLNHDKSITRDEFTTVWNKDVPTLKVIGRGLFYDLDTNNDRVIKDADLDAYVSRIDANKDGTVVEAEFVDYFTRLFDILYRIATIPVGGGTG